MPADPHEFPGLAVPNSPVFTRATDDRVTLSDGRTLLDLAMGFGAYIHGYGVASDVDRPTGVQGTDQVPAAGLGDLYSHELRRNANSAVCELVASNWNPHESPPVLNAMIQHTGSEAVETAIKTALLATGRTKIISFVGAYHGTFGLALSATHRADFRSPFASAYNADFVRFNRWGEIPDIGQDIACVIVEPWQGRAGVVPPPKGFLEGLRDACTRAGTLLVVDSILVGSGRAGSPMLGAELAPDILCLGKALGAGTAVSATVCTQDVATRAWGDIVGEAIHTTTFLADPVACQGLIAASSRSRETDWGAFDQRWRLPLTQLAVDLGYELRGQGLVWAIDTGKPGAGFAWSQHLLAEGVVVVPSGPSGESITLLPSTITDPNDAASRLLAM